MALGSSRRRYSEHGSLRHPTKYKWEIGAKFSQYLISDAAPASKQGKWDKTKQNLNPARLKAPMKRGLNGVQAGARRVGSLMKRAGGGIKSGARRTRPAISLAGRGIRSGARQVGPLMRRAGSGIKRGAIKTKPLINLTGRGIRGGARRMGPLMRRAGTGIKGGAKRAGPPLKRTGAWIRERARRMNKLNRLKVEHDHFPHSSIRGRKYEKSQQQYELAAKKAGIEGNKEEQAELDIKAKTAAAKLARRKEILERNLRIELYKVAKRKAKAEEKANKMHEGKHEVIPLMDALENEKKTSKEASK